MSNVVICILVTIVGLALVFWGIKTKTLKKILTGVGTSVLGVLALIFSVKSKQNKKLKEENAKLTKITEDANNRMNDIKDVVSDFKEKEQEIKVEKQELPNSGDSDSRLDRLNKLHNC